MNPILALQVGPNEDGVASVITGAADEKPLKVKHAVVGLCFLPLSQSTIGNDRDEDSCTISSTSTNDSPLQLRTASMLQSLVQTGPRSSHADDIDTAIFRPAAQLRDTQTVLRGQQLVTCHVNGDVHLWKLDVPSPPPFAAHWIANRGPALTVRRCHGDDHHIMYQTRDELGQVSWHDATTGQAIVTIHTYSQTFCAAAPCVDNPNLVALPTGSHNNCAIVRDWRVPPRDAPVFATSTTALSGGSGGGGASQGPHGMCQSLALCQTLGHLLLTCGMEDGSVMLYNVDSGTGTDAAEPHMLSLGTTPVLTLDVAPPPPTLHADHVTLAAGLAGDHTDQEGSAVLFTAQQRHVNSSWYATLQSRWNTCQMGPGRIGKPGISQCRFLNHTIFAVAGWDRRVRIYDASGTPQSIGKGHVSAVRCIDWATTGNLLASGGGDGRVLIWQYADGST